MAPTLFSMLSLGTSALMTQQILLDIAGQNIANAATPGYARQRADILQHPEYREGSLLFGLGSRVETIERVRETLIDARLRRENSLLGELAIRSDFLVQIEDILAAPSQKGTEQALSDFFDSLHELANNPENEGVRATVRDSGVTLANSITLSYDLLNRLRSNVNDFVSSTVDEINRLSAEISQLNRTIASMEGGVGTANASRDARDVLLNQLSELASVEITQSPNGTVSVYLDGYALVQDYTYNTIGLRVNPQLDPLRTDLLEVVASGDGNRPLDIRSGTLRGYLDVRDGVATEQVLSDLDQLALALIEEVNRIHSQGQGLARFESLTSEFYAASADAPLSGAGLPFTVVDGSFFLAVYDSQGGLLEQHEIAIDADVDSLNDVAASINAAFAADGRLTATVTADNRLVIETTTAGDTFSFVSDDTQAGDTSDFLLAMGLNAFFTFDQQLGPAASISVASPILSDVSYIAAGRSTGPGDNTNALALAQLRDTPVLGPTNNATMEEFFQATLVELGSTTREAMDRYEVQSGVVTGIENMRDSIMGVSLDEEGVNIIAAQQAYEASARFISAVADILDILMTELG
ncbi:MAG: flagellar hook-associated protein FlgK [Candidatus Abyssubacteria bacterium]